MERVWGIGYLKVRTRDCGGYHAGCVIGSHVHACIHKHAYIPSLSHTHAHTLSHSLQGSNSIAVGYDEGCVMVKIGREEPVASMDNSGKIIWARHNEVQTVNIKVDMALMRHTICLLQRLRF